MTVRIKKSTAAGEVFAPPSKSAAHRALICAALGGGKVSGISYSEDISATLDCLEALGATVDRQKDFVNIGGLVPKNSPSAILNCRESGSTLRFLIPLCMLCGKEITLRGADRLFERNLQVYEDLAERCGITFLRTKNSVTVCGTLKSGTYNIPGNISSQFISGLLFALPLLEGDSQLVITDRFESASYVALTVDALKRFGIDIVKKDNTYKIKGGQRYTACDITVEGDYSNAAFLDAFNLLGGNVAVKGLAENSIQGDRVYRQMFRDLLDGNRRFDLSDCPDLAPVMFALAAVLGGAEFTGTARLKIKESDRAEAMRQELSKFRIPVEVAENSVTVKKATLCAPLEVLNGHNDHRIVMALSLLCSITGGSVTDAEAVSKSFPDFFEKIKSLGIVVENEI